MGFAIAEELAEQGAEVILVSGPVAVSAQNKNIRIVHVESAEEMYQACIMHFPACNGAIMTAAVADFTPASPSLRKTKRKDKNLTIELKPTKDIAAALGKMKKPGQILGGFALETNDEMVNAQSKLNKKNFDFIVLNSLNDPGAGFGVDTNKITFIEKNNKIQAFELKSKREVAEDIVDKLIALVR